MKLGETWNGPEIRNCDLCGKRLSIQAIVSETKEKPRAGVVVCLKCFEEECTEKGEELIPSPDPRVWRKFGDRTRKEK